MQSGSSPSIAPPEPTRDSKPNPLHVTLDIAEESSIAEPTAGEKIVFFLSFVPILGYIGAAMAGFTMWANYRHKQPTHGLTYAALALQIFYTLLMLTALAIGTQIRQSSLNPAQPAEVAAQSFMSAVQEGNYAQAKAYFADSTSGALDVTLPMYRSSMRGTPLLVESRVNMRPTYRDGRFTAYNNTPMSYQLWHIGSRDTNSQYLILTLAQVSSIDWRIIQAQSLEAPGEVSAKAVLDQVVDELLVTNP